MSGVVRWEEPPKEHGNTKPKPPSKYQGVADDLRERPGQWAVIAEEIPTSTAGTLAFHVRQGIRSPWAPGGFESRTVGPVGGKARVYARYVGEEGVES